MTIDYSELCPVTQQQVAQLMEQEDHIESAGDNAVTDIRSGSGMQVHVSEIQPDSIIEVNGITGQVQHMIEAGLVDESILKGSYSDIETNAPDDTDKSEDVSYSQVDVLETANQIEEAIGAADTFESVTAVLAGEELSPEVLQELSETYGVSPERAAREVQQLTEQLYDDFAVYAEEELGVPDVDHFSEWVAYAVNQDTKIKQLYQQAVTGALSGDFELSQDLVQEYRKYYQGR